MSEYERGRKLPNPKPIQTIREMLGLFLLSTQTAGGRAEIQHAQDCLDFLEWWMRCEQGHMKEFCAHDYIDVRSRLGHAEARVEWLETHRDRRVDRLVARAKEALALLEEETYIQDDSPTGHAKAALKQLILESGE